jgi:hypothetical protein
VFPLLLQIVATSAEEGSNCVSGHSPAESLGRRDVLGLQADAPVTNLTKTVVYANFVA